MIIVFVVFMTIDGVAARVEQSNNDMEVREKVTL